MPMTFVRACAIIFVVLLVAWTHASQTGHPERAARGAAQASALGW